MSDLGFRQTLEVRTLGVHAEVSPSTCLFLAESLGSKLREEQHKRHRVYTGSGHHCGVIPYSSVWRGGLPLGPMMMNDTRKNSLARVCARGGVVPLEGLILDAYLIPRFLSRSSSISPAPSTLWVASPIYRRRPWASSQILSGKGANNWPI